MDRAELRQKITKAFSLTELRVLCFDNYVPYEDLQGKTLSDKVIELILYFERHSSTDELERICKALRPKTFTLLDVIHKLLLRQKREQFCLTLA